MVRTEGVAGAHLMPVFPGGDWFTMWPWASSLASIAPHEPCLNNTYHTGGYENSLINYDYRSSLCTCVPPGTIPLVLIEQYSVGFTFYVWGGTFYPCSSQLFGPDYFVWVIWLSGMFYLVLHSRCWHWEIEVMIISSASHPLQRVAGSFFSLQTCQWAGPFAS